MEALPYAWGKDPFLGILGLLKIRGVIGGNDMKDFLKDHPTLLEVLRFIAQDDPEKEKYIREFLGWTYFQEVIELLLELRKQPGYQDYGFEQGFGRMRISRDEALRFKESIKDYLSEDVEITVQTQNTFEDLIKQVRVHFVNDFEIGIQEKIGEPIVRYSFKFLGFGKKTQNVLLGLLEDREHLYSMGAARDSNRNPKGIYWNKQEMLNEISKKFIKFFNKSFNWSLPNKFKCHENVKSGKSGTYRFKFHMVNKDFDKEAPFRISRKKCLLKIEELKKKNIQSMTEKEIETFSSLLLTAKDHEWMSGDDLKKMWQDDLQHAMESDIKRGQILDPLGDEDYPDN
jgi:hypothetical protein